MQCNKCGKKTILHSFCRGCKNELVSKINELLPQIITKIFYINFSNSYILCYNACKDLEVLFEEIKDVDQYYSLDISDIKEDFEYLKEVIETKKGFDDYFSSLGKRLAIRIRGLKFIDGKFNQELYVYFKNIIVNNEKFNVSVTKNSVEDFIQTLRFLEKEIQNG